jgi:hypothetical protein
MALLLLHMALLTHIYTHHIIFLRSAIPLRPHTINGALTSPVPTQLRMLKTLHSSLALVHGFKNLIMASVVLTTIISHNILLLLTVTSLRGSSSLKTSPMTS